MEILSFIAHLMSGVILLLFAVNFMRIGIERLYSAEITQMMSNPNAKTSLLAKGAFLGFTLQGGTVVVLMCAALAGSGTIPVLSGALLSLGADFGSALAVQILQLPIASLGALIVAVGGWLYLNSKPGLYRRDMGRILFGLGLVFLSLGVIRNAVAPLQGLSATPTLVAAIGADPVNAALIGLTLTLIMHSSLAAILTTLALVAHISLSPVSGLGLVLGANIGSALLPLWLLRRAAPASLAVPRVIAAIRIAFALLLLVGVAGFGPRLSDLLAPLPTRDIMLMGHLGFNFLLLFLAPFAALASRFFAPQEAGPPSVPWIAQGGAKTSPDIAVAEIKRQVNAMLETLSRMLDNVTATTPDREAIAADEATCNAGLSQLRSILTCLPDYPKPVAKQINELIDFAIRIERCADIVSGKYLNIRIEEHNGLFTQSQTGADQIRGLLEQLQKTRVLAQSVFWSENPEQARVLVGYKQTMTKMEEASRRDHLQRIQAGDAVAMMSSNQHLEMIAALKEINSKLATVGYAVLDRHGALRKSRLKAGTDAVAS